MVNGRGRMKGSALGPSGECICLSCGNKILHKIGIPCTETKCPNAEAKWQENKSLNSKQVGFDYLKEFLCWKMK